MDDIPWQIVILIFLAFFGWLRGKIQEAKARREQMLIDRERHRRRAKYLKEKEEEEQEYRSPYRDQPQTQPEPEYEAAPPTVVQRPPSSLQDLFEQVTQAHRQQTESRTPPPLPTSEETEEEPFETPEPVVFQAPMARQTSTKKSSDVGSTIQKAFSSRNEIRNALILKEVLDTPKGLR